MLYCKDPPSKVIHFRNVTQDIEQADVMSVCTPFGPVDKVLLMRTKNQCLLSFKDIAASIHFMNYYTDTNSVPMAKGRKLYCRFSRHQELTSSGNAPGSTSRIVLATLQTSFRPEDYGISISADIVWQIFSPYGTVEKIVMLTKDQGLQALVQYSDSSGSAQAFQFLHNKVVYVQTEPAVDVTIYLQYSHLNDLTVRAQSAKSRDYISMPMTAVGSVAPEHKKQLTSSADAKAVAGIGGGGSGLGMSYPPGFDPNYAMQYQQMILQQQQQLYQLVQMQQQHQQQQPK